MSAKHKIVAIMGHGFPLTMHKAKELVKDSLEISVYFSKYLDEGKEDLELAFQDMEKRSNFFNRFEDEIIWSELENKAKELATRCLLFF